MSWKKLLLNLTLGKNCWWLPQRMWTFGNLQIKLILDLLLSFKLQNIKRKQLIRKAKYKRFVKKLWFFMQLRLHFLWKTLPLKSLFVQYAVFFYPSYRVENQDEYIWGFGLLSDRLKSLKQLPSSKYVEKQKSVTKFLSKMFRLYTSRSFRHLICFSRDSTKSWIPFFLIKHSVMNRIFWR